MPKKSIWIIRAGLVIIAAVLLRGLFYHPRPLILRFSARYLYTTEITYEEINIAESKLTYTYFEDADNKCAGWTAQSPCWKKKDLITKEVILSQGEIADLINLIKQSGFMRLENIYGGADKDKRYYPFKLSVSIGDETKEVIYQSFPQAAPAPEAFEEVKRELFDLIGRKIK